ncbi:MAG: ABC transporter ATP-binding protein/permease [Oscillospiraceae bacterium]|nr:ABC transporter ATP-binding protein/permease [Oscillospiraceae bacterium]
MKGIKKIRYLLFLLKPRWKYGKTYFIITILVAALLQPASAVLATLMPKIAIDALMTGAGMIDIIKIITIFTLFIMGISIAHNVITQVYGGVMESRINYKIMQEVADRALHTDFKYYDNPDFFNTFSYAQENYSPQAKITAQLVPVFLELVVTTLAMAVIISQAGAILLLITIAFVAMQALLNLPIAKLGADFSVKVNSLSRPIVYIYRSLLQKENAADMRTSSAGGKLLQNYASVTKHFVDSFREFVVKNIKYSVPQGILAAMQNAVVLIYIVAIIIGNDLSKIGLYASLSVAAGVLSTNVKNFLNHISRLYELTMYGERIAQFFETESTIETPASIDALSPPEGQYSIEFQNVSFRYENAQFAIEDFNLSIPAGSRVAIVGENGAGKSTLTKLLLRLYDVEKGEILINGRDIREYNIHALRKKIGIAYQDVRILAMSLRDNLTVYNDVTDEELINVMNKLGLNEVLEKAGGDLDIMVSREFTQDGIVLSGGEAQRIAVARLFTGSFGLLMLDEPSSSLDPLAEYNLMKQINDSSNTATTIMIAHRLSTVRDFDIIYHVSQGNIIESGTHEQLMEAEGKYYEMFMRQAENYQDIRSEDCQETYVHA